MSESADDLRRWLVTIIYPNAIYDEHFDTEGEAIAYFEEHKNDAVGIDVCRPTVDGPDSRQVVIRYPRDRGPADIRGPESRSMVRIRDLFADRTVQIELVATRWVVAVCRHDGTVQLASSYASRIEALEGIEAWMDLMSDEAEIEPDVDLDSVFSMLWEAAARRAVGEGLEEPIHPSQAIELNRQREWYRREMGE